LFHFVISKRTGRSSGYGGYRDQKTVSPESKLVSEQSCHKYLFQDSRNWSKANKQTKTELLKMMYQWVLGNNSGNPCHYCWAAVVAISRRLRQHDSSTRAALTVKTASFPGRGSTLNLFQRMEGPVPTIFLIKVANTLGNNYRKAVALLA